MYLKGHNDSQVTGFFIRKKRILIPIALGLMAVGLFAAGIFGGFMLEKKFKSPEKAAKYIWCNKMKPVANVAQGQNPYPSGLKTFHLDIGHKEYQRLVFKRQEAMKQKLLLSSEDDYVPGQATLDGETHKIKVRLKGDLPDHFDADRWSLRVVVKDDQTLMGMRRFSLNLPVTRNFLYEWIALRLCGREGLIALRYEFVKVILNGKDLGVYALEEHFDKRLLENNNRREGVILKYDESNWWRERIGYDERRRLPGTGNFQQADLDVFNQTSTLLDSNLTKQYRAASTLFDGFRRGELPAPEVFDLEKVATFVAICDLMGTSHPLHTNQLRWYFNPITAKLEPIPFDILGGFWLRHMSGASTLADDYEWEGGGYADWLVAFFKDPAAFEFYTKALQRISKPDYLETFLAEEDSALSRHQAILKSEYPCWDFHTRVLTGNQAYIRKMLKPLKGVNAFFVKKGKNNITIDAGNIQRMPIEILGVSWRDSLFFPIKSPAILYPHHPKRRVLFQQLSVSLPAGVPYPDTLAGTFTLIHRVVGMDDSLSSAIRPWPYFDAATLPQTPRIEDKPFWVFDTEKKELEFKPGMWKISTNLVIPSGITLKANEGIELDLQNGAGIICHSPAVFSGTDLNPIRVVSTDSTGRGLLLLGKGKSLFEWVEFINLDVPLDGSRQITGAVTVYESIVKFANCRFEYSRCEDALNLIRSEVLLDHCRFGFTQGDALDLDFCHGKILNCEFINAGNDAIDASGSQLVINDIGIEKSGDKGISAGEKSFMTGNRVVITHSPIGIASKDLSEVILNEVEVLSCERGLLAFQKKSEFGGAKVVITNGRIEDAVTEFMPEKQSVIWFNKKHIPSTYEGVADSLYEK